MINMTRLKSLLPSLKEKKRYLAFEVVSKNPVSFKDVKESIISKYKEYFGIFGLAKANLKILDEWKNKKGIIKVENKYVDETKSSMVLIKKINDQNVIVRCIGVSGIINKLKKRYMEV